MHIATLEYRLKEEHFEEFVSLWKEVVLESVRGRPGLVEFRLLAQKPRALAIGVWEDLSFARAFMATGVFGRLLARAGAFIETENPSPRGWALAASLDALSLDTAPPPPKGLDPKLLAAFLVEAKRATYASGASPASEESSETVYRYQSGGFAYEDRFVGSLGFVGRETATYDGRPIWAMSYHGSTSPDASEDMPAFLKAALSLVAVEAPFRGPLSYTEAERLYLCRHSGSLGLFRGEESIHEAERSVFSLVFQGGWLL